MGHLWCSKTFIAVSMNGSDHVDQPVMWIDDEMKAEQRAQITSNGGSYS